MGLRTWSLGCGGLGLRAQDLESRMWGLVFMSVQGLGPDDKICQGSLMYYTRTTGNPKANHYGPRKKVKGVPFRAW